MSCEQVRAEIDEKIDSVPKGSRVRMTLLAAAWALNDGCPNKRAKLTHTARMLNAEKNAGVDRIWQKNKETAEATLREL